MHVHMYVYKHQDIKKLHCSRKKRILKFHQFKNNNHCANNINEFCNFIMQNVTLSIFTQRSTERGQSAVAQGIKAHA